MWRVPSFSAAPGAYGWLYADAQCGPYAVVCIFMVGAVFSPRYAVAQRRGGLPLEHCAVNCALHRDGRRLAWVFTERRGMRIEDDGRTLRIGGSCLRYADDGRIHITVAERTAPWGRRLDLRLTLAPLAPPGPEVALDAGARHHWQALVPRAAAVLAVPGGPEQTGLGYHDTNRGTERLGLGVRGWRWSRIHDPAVTTIRYERPTPLPALELVARAEGVETRTTPAGAEPTRRSPWGLRLPTVICAGSHRVPVTEVLESSPFYARQQGRRGSLLALAEVADFARFHSPLIRWMAHFRLRVEAA